MMLMLMQAVQQQQISTGKPVHQLTVSKALHTPRQQLEAATKDAAAAPGDAAVAADIFAGPQTSDKTAPGTTAVADINPQSAAASAAQPAIDPSAAAGPAQSPRTAAQPSKELQSSAGAPADPQATDREKGRGPSAANSSITDAQELSVLVAARGPYQIMILRALQLARYVKALAAMLDGLSVSSCQAASTDCSMGCVSSMCITMVGGCPLCQVHLVALSHVYSFTFHCACMLEIILNIEVRSCCLSSMCIV